MLIQKGCNSGNLKPKSIGPSVRIPGNGEWDRKQDPRLAPPIPVPSNPSPLRIAFCGASYLIWFFTLYMYTWFRLRSISASSLTSTVLLIQGIVGWTLGEFTMMLQLLSIAPLVGDLNAWKRL